MRMRIEINSLEELIELSALLGAASLQIAGSQLEPVKPYVINVHTNKAADPVAETRASAQDTKGAEPAAAEPAAQDPGAGATPPVQAASGRKPRKTKAEKEAEAAATVPAPDSGADAEPVTFDKSDAETAAERVASATNSLDNLKAEHASAPAAADKAEPAASTAAPSDIEHLKLCREFISLHGMSVYEQSFGLAGIEGKNIMAFSDEDRAKHVAALNKLVGA